MNGARLPENVHGRAVLTSSGNASAQIEMAKMGAARAWVSVNTPLTTSTSFSPAPPRLLCSENVAHAFKNAAHAA